MLDNIVDDKSSGAELQAGNLQSNCRPEFRHLHSHLLSQSSFKVSLLIGSNPNSPSKRSQNICICSGGQNSDMRWFHWQSSSSPSPSACCPVFSLLLLPTFFLGWANHIFYYRVILGPFGRVLGGFPQQFKGGWCELCSLAWAVNFQEGGRISKVLK